MDYEWVKDKLDEVYEALNRLEAMILKTGSGSSAVEHENKGDDMLTKRDQQAASGGGEGVAVVCGVRIKSGTFNGFLFQSREQANKCEELITDEVVAFFEEPPKPRGWLREEERSLLLSLADSCDIRARLLDSPGTMGSGLPKPEDVRADAAMLRAILARSSPPEVVLPPIAALDMQGVPVVRLVAVRSALTAAGVPWKDAK
jgi:hypothetical protein